ncbi:hypothetical protein J4210_05040 [Candidatus Woesearchaeota archaeon]|nr:hypothetical protein [Candidatus Woesearchaeota archaeon]
MITSPNLSREYRAFKILQHWRAIHTIVPADQLITPEHPSFPLFFFLYQKTETLYQRLSKRRNGEEAFIHPINVVLALKEAEIDEGNTLCAGLIHDYIEESVDLYKEEMHLSDVGNDASRLDEMESQLTAGLKSELIAFSEKGTSGGGNSSAAAAEELVAITQLLTRHKRDFYYKSICNLFTGPDPTIKEKAIQIKLADRMHNTLSIESFSEQDRLYSCFKNLFILNNTKKYLAEIRGNLVFSEELTETERLFKRLAKATYDAFLQVCENATKKGIGEVRSMLHLAFRKFAWEKNGVFSVTELTQEELHLMRLYFQVIRKYDCRLRHKWEELQRIQEEEFAYCQQFFADFNFTDAQIQAILDYKDAYSLKEVIGMLLYVPEYVVKRFDYTDLFCEN